ncbi:unnamed protein product [Rhizoctonia solani]|uniref:Peptidase S8/S53 domain-containing protein n=1 Tax=Rhizoctonia solani TaxID=456999 RepID=A0A8H3DPC7_9AGAM|nr:unnamed protein product [Rhizoctonia solani]
MSLGGSPSFVLNRAVANTVREGSIVCVSAGNKKEDSFLQSPANSKSAICVGSTMIKDERSSFPNHGLHVDIFAPGSSIASAGITSRTVHSTKSGTSVATPHIAGVVARILSAEPNLTPTGVRARPENTATARGALRNIPDYKALDAWENDTRYADLTVDRNRLLHI